ncbi:MAG: hypothetical protein AAGB13_03125 [Cyanobacteria bacterium P01_F01_bin.33]
MTFNGFTQQAQTAFQFAVDIWASLLDISVPLEIEANFTPLGSNILGSAGPATVVRDFSGATQANTWYPIALANQLSGADLAPNTPDITVNISSNFTNWYFDTDGNAPSNQFDFVTVVLHELGHGLGLIDFFDYNAANGQGQYGFGSGYPSIFDRFIENGAGVNLVNGFSNPSVALGNQLVGNDLFFDGPNANAANGGNPSRLFAPSPFQPGSSIAHLNESTFGRGTPDGLMTPQLASGEVIHAPGPITLGIFADLGWQTASAITVEPETEIRLDGSGNLIVSDINGGNSNDTLTFERVGNTLIISDPNQPLSAGSGVSSVDDNTVEIAFGAVTGTINVNTLGGKDAIATSSISKALVVAGGSGNDSITSDAGNDTLSGNAGNDSLVGRDGSDRLQGDSGADTLKGGNGQDSLYGNDGKDKLYGDWTSGGTGNDFLSGGNNNDFLYGRGGNDLLHGDDGNDRLQGDAGADTLKGGGGRDTLYGNDGNDRLYGDWSGGGTGNDSIVGGLGNDSLYGRGGSDRLIGGKGNDVLVGDAGNDTLTGAGGSHLGQGSVDRLQGGAGGDLYVLGDGNNAFYDDGFSGTAGTADYARIQGFSAVEDRIQLEGTATDYVLGSSPISGISGTAVYLNASTDELVAVVEGVSGLSLSSSAFIYV